MCDTKGSSPVLVRSARCSPRSLTAILLVVTFRVQAARPSDPTIGAQGVSSEQFEELPSTDISRDQNDFGAFSEAIKSGNMAEVNKSAALAKTDAEKALNTLDEKGLIKSQTEQETEDQFSKLDDAIKNDDLDKVRGLSVEAQHLVAQVQQEEEISTKQEREKEEAQTVQRDATRDTSQDSSSVSYAGNSDLSIACGALGEKVHELKPNDMLKMLNDCTTALQSFSGRASQPLAENMVDDKKYIQQFSNALKRLGEIREATENTFSEYYET